MPVSYSGTAITWPDNSTTTSGWTGFKNRIINGAMMIDQRNAGAAVTVNNNTNNYTLDRWNTYGQPTDGVFTVQQSTDAPTGFKNSLKVTVTTADASIGSTQSYALRYSIEGLNCADLGFGTANASTTTLSFWVKSSVTGTYSVGYINDGYSRAYPTTFTINSANTWEYKSVTVAGDTTGTWATDNTTGIRLWWSLGAGTTATANTWNSGTAYVATGATNLISTNGATFYITGVQLERGSTASSFEYVDYGRQLIQCQRYYYKVSTSQNFLSVGTTYSTYNVYGPANLPVKMRTTPSFSYSDVGHFAIAYGVSGYACTVLGLNAGASDFPSVYATQAGTSFTSGSCGMIYISNASGWWSWSAEL